MNVHQLTSTFICATSYRLSVGTACYLYIGSRLLQLRRISCMLALWWVPFVRDSLLTLSKKWSPYDIMSPKINHNTSHQPSVSSSSITVVWNMSYSRITWRQPNSELKPNEPQSFNQFEKKVHLWRNQVTSETRTKCTMYIYVVEGVKEHFYTKNSTHNKAIECGRFVINGTRAIR